VLTSTTKTIAIIRGSAAPIKGMILIQNRFGAICMVYSPFPLLKRSADKIMVLREKFLIKLLAFCLDHVCLVFKINPFDQKMYFCSLYSLLRQKSRTLYENRIDKFIDFREPVQNTGPMCS
jgi:hypothetical protein